MSLPIMPHSPVFTLLDEIEIFHEDEARRENE